MVHVPIFTNLGEFRVKIPQKFYSFANKLLLSICLSRSQDMTGYWKLANAHQDGTKFSFKSSTQFVHKNDT